MEHSLPSYKDFFKQDIVQNIKKKTLDFRRNIFMPDLIDEAVYYAADMCLEFYSKSGHILPQNWVDHIINETCAAFKELPDEVKKQLHLNYGLQVTGVTKGKMADAGIRKGFIILKANGENMRTVEDLEAVVREATQSPDQSLFLSGVFPSGKRGIYAVDLSQGE